MNKLIMTIYMSNPLMISQVIVIMIGILVAVGIVAEQTGVLIGDSFSVISITQAKSSPMGFYN